MPKLTPKKLHARLIATRELLTDLAQETHATLKELTTSDADADTFFAYRRLADAIQSAASDATLLAASASTAREATRLANETVEA